MFRTDHFSENSKFSYFIVKFLVTSFLIHEIYPKSSFFSKVELSLLKMSSFTFGFYHKFKGLRLKFFTSLLYVKFLIDIYPDDSD